MEKQNVVEIELDQKEKRAIALENNILAILVPAVGIAAFIVGLVGFILTIAQEPGTGVLLLILALLGAGGIAYGVLVFLKRRFKKFHKEESVPSETPNR
jgi:hypothetical protein